MDSAYIGLIGVTIGAISALIGTLATNWYTRENKKLEKKYELSNNIYKELFEKK